MLLITGCLWNVCMSFLLSTFCKFPRLYFKAETKFTSKYVCICIGCALWILRSISMINSCMPEHFLSVEVSSTSKQSRIKLSRMQALKHPEISITAPRTTYYILLAVKPKGDVKQMQFFAQRFKEKPFTY